MKAMMFVTGAMTVNLIGLGDELGFYQALKKANGGAMASSELAKATGTHERWTREWLHQQASCSLTSRACYGHHAAARTLGLPVPCCTRTHPSGRHVLHDSIGYNDRSLHLSRQLACRRSIC